MKVHTECLGCRLANKEEPVNVVYENEVVCCILDHDPFNEGHVMILPKGHVEDMDELDEETANTIIQTSRLLTGALKTLYQPDGITIVQNGGIFSDLSHFHLHVVPRYKHQSFADFYLDAPLDNEDAKSRLEETRRRMTEFLGATHSK